MQPHGPWTILKSHEIYQDPWLSVRRDDVLRPDGNPGTYSTVKLKPGVTVIAVGSQEEVYLTREFHYAVGEYTIEGVSGGIESDESPLETGKRELREEIGIVAGEWIDLGIVNPFTAAILSPTQLYLASQLSFVNTEQEATEEIECVRYPFNEAVQMVLKGQITHAPTCVALLKLSHMIQNGLQFGASEG